MQIVAQTLDDLLRETYNALLEAGDGVTASKGSFLELRGATLRLANPRSRLSRSYHRGRAFSSLGELCWYLAGSESTEFIEHYISAYREADEDGSIPSAYGPRFRGEEPNDQLRRITELLRAKPTSRRAVVQLFDRRDLLFEHAEVPCTCTLQFLARDGKLELLAMMRSSDAFLGLPHDVFAFTMLQELVARDLDLELGEYVHFAGSLHLYDDHHAPAREFLREGMQSLESMPPMPVGDPWPAVEQLLVREESIRTGLTRDPRALDSGYWGDLARILLAHSLDDPTELEQLRRSLSSPFFDLYVKERQFRRSDRDS